MKTALVYPVLFLAFAGLSASADEDARPPHISTDASIQYDYDIVYVRVPRPYPKEYNGINHLNQAGLHQTHAPGAELRLLHPDGKDESLVPVTEQEAITDPMVSFDGQWVYFAKFHHMAKGSAHMSKLRSQQGADIYKIHVSTRKIVRLTQQLVLEEFGFLVFHFHGITLKCYMLERHEMQTPRLSKWGKLIGKFVALA
jgi:hypothetical protein